MEDSVQTSRHIHQIRQQIELTRERMSETIDAIAYKLDVPSRVKERVSDGVSAAKQAVVDSVSTAKEAVRSGIDSATGAAKSVPRDDLSGSNDRPSRGS